MAVVAVLLVALPLGPTALWRHAPIGAGRVGIDKIATRNDVDDLIRDYRGAMTWQAEGRESSLAADGNYGLSLIVNGKSDGNVIDDVGTQIMSGMMGAFLHPNPRSALVIGLGTGTTAGWLGTVPSIENVDVVELESEVVHFAKLCSAANLDVVHNPKVHIRIGDGREYLLTKRTQYDIVASEPSNPYRAGVASLYTREFYAAAASRLTGNGLFLQWLQVYDTDPELLGVVFATLRSVFPNIETWSTLEGDLLLVASRAPIPHNVADLRARGRGALPFRAASRVASS